MKEIIQKAPCRMDLAGGTLDLWPLYLYCGGLKLVNMAIQVQATAQITWEPAKTGHRFQIESLDLHSKQSYSSLDELVKSLNLDTQKNPLRWVNRLVAARLLEDTSRSPGKWTITTSSEAPPGSGLGGSSVLGIALRLALEKILGNASAIDEALKWKIQQQTRDLEAVEIEHPAGDQDYVPALFGGLLIFELDYNVRRAHRLPDSCADWVSNHTALLYTGKPHHSGLNNWTVFEAFHKGDTAVRKHLKEIGELSRELAGKLEKQDFSELASLINQEWEIRKTLSSAIDAPVLEAAWIHAKTLGATARKACGSGGGGCLLLYFEDQETRDTALEKHLPDPSWKWLNTKWA